MDPVTAADSRTTRHSDLGGLAALEQVFSGSLKRVGPAAEGMRSELVEQALLVLLREACGLNFEKWEITVLRLLMLSKLQYSMT